MFIPNYWSFDYDDFEEYFLKMREIIEEGNKVGIRYTTHKLIVYELPGNDPLFKDSDIWEFFRDIKQGVQSIRPIKALYKYTPYITEEMLK